MQRHLEAGVSAAQAAQLALAETAAGDADQLQSAGLAPLANQLRTALDRLDEPGANAVLDRGAVTTAQRHEVLLTPGGPASAQGSSSESTR